MNFSPRQMAHIMLVVLSCQFLLFSTASAFALPDPTGEKAPAFADIFNCTDAEQLYEYSVPLENLQHHPIPTEHARELAENMVQFENQISIQCGIDLYYSRQYKKCIKYVNKNEEYIGLLWCKCLSEYQLNNKKKAYFLLEKILLNKKIGLAGSREWIKPLLNDEKAISLILKYKSNDELKNCIEALEIDDYIDLLFYEKNNRLKNFYEEKIDTV